ncbi:MAG: DUF5655 domain-containing protein [Dokdonella sp.]
MDHRAEFLWLVMDKLGKAAADQVDWSGTRLLCIAADFTRYDQHAVQQIARNIELLRYKLFDHDLLLLELVNSVSVPDATSGKESGTEDAASSKPKSAASYKTADDQLEQAQPAISALFDSISGYLLALGDDVQQKHLKYYIAFRRLKNFACVVPFKDKLLVLLKLDPRLVHLEEGFSRDVGNLGKWGTGDLELCLRTTADFERAKSYLDRSYAEN